VKGTADVDYECITVDRSEPFAAVTMNLPDRRNALGLRHLSELADAFRSVGESDALGVVLAGNGPVFSAGHDFSEMAGSDLVFMQRLLRTCVEFMDVIQSVPQVVIARVHGLATAAGCQLVATCDLAVAAESAAFAVPGGKGGWFCTTPLVALGRNIGRKRAFEMALTGDTVDAKTAADWGLVNRVVPDPELDAATAELLERATRGSPLSKAIGKRALYHQLGLSQDDAYSYALEVMAAASQTADAQEGMAAFVEKRPPKWSGS